MHWSIFWLDGIESPNEENNIEVHEVYEMFKGNVFILFQRAYDPQLRDVHDFMTRHNG